MTGVQTCALPISESQFIALAGGSAFGNELIHELRNIVLNHLHGEGLVLKRILKLALHFAKGDLVVADERDDRLITASVSTTDAAGDQIGHHGQGDEAEHDRQSSANRFIAAAENIKHERETPADVGLNYYSVRGGDEFIRDGLGSIPDQTAKAERSCWK